jgi:diguanylate cyclase (GGDEF)-like protein/PAS domain S-box-containing protein
VNVPRSVAACAGVVLVCATIACSVVGFAHDARERDAARAHAQRAAARALTGGLGDLAARTSEVGGLFEASDDVTASEFATFADRPLHDGRALSFAWVQHVGGAERAGFERAYGLRVQSLRPDGRLRPAAPKAAYDVLTYVRSRAAARVPLGFDASSEPARRRAMDTASALMRPQATPVLRLAGGGPLAILVYSRVASRDGGQQGFVAGTFAVRDLVSSIASVLPAGAAFSLEQHGVRVGGVGDATGGDRTVLDIVGQRWALTVAPAPASSLSSGAIALVVGGLLTGFVLLALLQLTRDANRARRLAAEREHERDVADGGRRAMEERFARAFDDAPVGMALLDPAGRHLRVNEALADMLGYSRAELTELTLDDVVAGGDRTARRALLDRLLTGATRRHNGTAQLLHASGRVVDASVHLTALEGDGGSAPAILVHAVDVTEQRMDERRLRHLADHDPLTGLLNRRGFSRVLQRQIAHVRRYGVSSALLLLDLDGFKAVNDGLGHPAGDRVLQDVARLLHATLRETDVIARLGGDEFAVILPGETPEQAAVVASKIVDCVRAAELGVVDQRVTASVGVAAFGRDVCDPDDVLSEADSAMYAAKAAGRDGFVVYAEAPAAAAAA